MKTQHAYRFSGDDGLLKRQDVLKMFCFGFKSIGGLPVKEIVDHSNGADRCSGAGVLEYRLAGGSSVIIRPVSTEPELEVIISIAGDSTGNAAGMEERIRKDLESIIYMDHGMGYCCE